MRQRFQRERRTQLAEVEAGAGRHVVAGALGTAVGEVLAERAEAAHEGDELLLVEVADRLVERALVERLGEKLGEMAGDVAAHLALADWLAVERAVVLEQRVAIVVDDHLERHAELAAIAEDRGVVLGQPRRPGVEIKMLAAAPCDRLHAVGFFHAIAAA